MLRLGITDNVTLQTLSDPLHSAADVATFVNALAKEAVPAALPGVAPGDVAVPFGPTTVLLFAPGTESLIYGLSSSGHRRLRSSAPAAEPSTSTSSNSTGMILNAQIGVMLQITLPYTVNTTDAISAYLQVGDCVVRVCAALVGCWVVHWQAGLTALDDGSKLAARRSNICYIQYHVIDVYVQTSC